MKRLLPVVILALALFLGVGVGLGTFWMAAKPLVLAARKPVVKEAARPEKPWDFWTLEVENLATELKEQKAVLAQREETVRARETRLAAEQAELAQTRQEIERLRAEFQKQLIELQVDETKNLKTLATTYSELTPKAIVPILRQLDERTAVKILALMKPDVVAPIFEEMGKLGSADPTVARLAATLSERLRVFAASRQPAQPKG